MKVWVRCARGVQVAYGTLDHRGCTLVPPSTWAKRVPREASSTGSAAPAPAPRATTHQGSNAVGKRLQLRLLSDALTGEWQNGEAGEGQGSEPREPGGLRDQAGGVS